MESVRFCKGWSQDSVGIGNTPSSTAIRLFYYMQGMGYFKTDSSYFTERSGMPSFLLIFTLSGQGYLETSAGSTHLLPGTCTLINCMEHHRYGTLANAQKWDFLWLHFSGSCTLGFYQEFVHSVPRAVTVSGPSPFSDHFRKLFALQKEHSYRSELLINQEILTMLTRLLLAGNPLQTDFGVYPDYLQKIILRLDQSYAEPLTLESLANCYGISKFHLSREFKLMTGTTFSDYLMRLRLSHAKELLRFTDLPVGEVAAQCGFRDSSYFIRIFKRLENSVTPFAYRKFWSETKAPRIAIHR